MIDSPILLLMYMHTHPRYSLVPKVSLGTRLPRYMLFILCYLHSKVATRSWSKITAPSLPLLFSHCPSTSPTAPKPPIHLEILPGLPALLSLSRFHQRPVESRPLHWPQQPDCSHQLQGKICVRDEQKEYLLAVDAILHACSSTVFIKRMQIK